MKFSNKTLVLVDSGGTSYIGKIKEYHGDYNVILNEAFKLVDINAITPEGMILKAGAAIQPIMQGRDKPEEIHVHICAIMEVTTALPLYKNYEGMMAKCAGIVLAPANALNNIKKFEL